MNENHDYNFGYDNAIFDVKDLIMNKCRTNIQCQDKFDLLFELYHSLPDLKIYDKFRKLKNI